MNLKRVCATSRYPCTHSSTNALNFPCTARDVVPGDDSARSPLREAVAAIALSQLSKSWTSKDAEIRSSFAVICQRKRPRTTVTFKTQQEVTASVLLK